VLINGANYGLTFGSWLGYGALFAVIAMIISYAVYSLAIFKVLKDRHIIIISEKEEIKRSKNIALLKKTLFVSISIALSLFILIIIVTGIGRRGFTKKLVFDSCDDFKAFMESDYERWYKEGYSYIKDGNVVNVIPVIPSDQEDNESYDLQKEYAHILNSNGEIICEYYYNPNLYKQIIFTGSSHDKMPVTVITTQAYYNGMALYESTVSLLYALIAIDFVAAIFIYIRKARKTK
jgi:hypothetical protein